MCDFNKKRKKGKHLQKLKNDDPLQHGLNVTKNQKKQKNDMKKFLPSDDVVNAQLQQIVKKTKN